MTLHQFEIWIAVAKHQNVTKTADELHIRQPSVSQQIKSLEKNCGIKLYRTRGLNPRVRPKGKAAASPLWKPHRLCARLKRRGFH